MRGGVPMNVLKFIAWLVGLAPRVIEGVNELRDAGPVEPIPFGRRHFWDPYLPGPTLKRRDTPICVYCKTLETEQNEFAECPGPK